MLVFFAKKKAYFSILDVFLSDFWYILHKINEKDTSTPPTVKVSTTTIPRVFNSRITVYYACPKCGETCWPIS